MDEHEKHIRQTIELAQKAIQKGNQPFGALLVSEGEVLLTAENSVFTEGDITCHAELNLVRLASRQLSAEKLAECTLYTSTEPCAMCAGAIYWAGIKVVAFGCSAESLGHITGGHFVVPCRQLFGHGKRKTQVFGPILEEESIAIHQAFWPHRSWRTD